MSDSPLKQGLTSQPTRQRGNILKIPVVTVHRSRSGFCFQRAVEGVSTIETMEELKVVVLGFAEISSFFPRP